MYTIINRRKFNRDRVQETMQRAQTEFLPKLKAAPGFVGFYLVTDEENGINNAIIVFEDKAHADAFQEEGRKWAGVLDEMGHVVQSDNRGETVIEVRP